MWLFFFLEDWQIINIQNVFVEYTFAEGNARKVSQPQNIVFCSESQNEPSWSTYLTILYIGRLDIVDFDPNLLQREFTITGESMWDKQQRRNSLLF